MVDGLLRLAGILRTAGRLWWRHWPALLALACLGVAIRAGLLWAAIHVSDAHHLLGRALLILGPPGFLLPLVAAMYVCRASLPRLAQLSRLRPEMPTEQRPERPLDIAASVLIPFLAIYESYGLFDQDVRQFRNAAAYAELGKVFNDQQADLAGRLGIYSVPTAVGIVAGAWVLRFALGWLERLSSLLVLGYVGALGDVTYTSQLAGQYAVFTSNASLWVRERRGWTWVSSVYEDVERATGFLAAPARALLDLFSGVADSWEQLILIPLGWLAVGLVVLARGELEEEAEHTVDDGADGKPAQAAPRRPWPLRLLLGLLADVKGRLGALYGALRQLAASGLGTMLAFCLVLLVVVRLPGVLYPLQRHLLGPSETFTFLAFSPMLDALILALSMALTIPLVAAGVDYVATRRLEREGLVADLDRRAGGAPVRAASDAEVAAGDGPGQGVRSST